ncbi:MAG: shikimate kinase [Elusimicrobia bacterium]|nr:shikimate kinase [Elusimicrobiota bacterium]
MAGPRVFLVGYMAAGKTSVGKALARLEGRPFVDTDALVMALARRPVARIFAAEGEEGFRRREARALARAARVPRAVVAVGGGAVTRPANRALMRRSGTVVWLQASYAASAKRAAGEGGAAKRPLLSGGRALFSKRRALYAKAAALVVRSDRGTPEAVARRLAARLKGRE